ncbi:Predicted arabinose efflux permease, MFS family [Bacteroides luti]|uniref:Predicted arabinose efflux permease, MFS family n=1 Tax=Bacteroides luti TaxID=1297750 RepID=A0A1M5EC39_9BACE|nr:MFS transporter [Bacteroides luti]SHF76843.1 Predicted arabinose efflux permease, MFS family [Bacteroides luti]
MYTVSTAKLWTSNFVWAYISNFLLFVSLYMFLPILPMYMVAKFPSTTLGEAGIVLALFAGAMFLVGPFYSYIIDTYKRKDVCMFSFLTVIAIVGGYSLIGCLFWMAVLRIIQGALFGITTATSSTVAIDITSTTRRSEGNIHFNWAGRLGMAFGPMFGLLLFSFSDLQTVLYASIAAGFAGFLCMAIIKVPFRAPIGAKAFSTDRFLLSRGWVTSGNLVLISIIFGMLISTINVYAASINLQYVTIRFFGAIGFGFILAMIANRVVFVEADFRARIVSGLILIILSLLLLITHYNEISLITSGVLIGLGFGLAASDFLVLFVNLSEHCQRGTANTNYLLAWEVGVGIGVALGCNLVESGSYMIVFQVGIIFAVIALLYFLLFTTKHFVKNKKR